MLFYDVTSWNFDDPLSVSCMGKEGTESDSRWGWLGLACKTKKCLVDTAKNWMRAMDALRLCFIVVISLTLNIHNSTMLICMYIAWA